MPWFPCTTCDLLLQVWIFLKKTSILFMTINIILMNQAFYKQMNSNINEFLHKYEHTHL